MGNNPGYGAKEFLNQNKHQLEKHHQHGKGARAGGGGKNNHQKSGNKTVAGKGDKGEAGKAGKKKGGQGTAAGAVNNPMSSFPPHLQRQPVAGGREGKTSQKTSGKQGWVGVDVGGKGCGADDQQAEQPAHTQERGLDEKRQQDEDAIMCDVPDEAKQEHDGLADEKRKHEGDAKMNDVGEGDADMSSPPPSPPGAPVPGGGGIPGVPPPPGTGSLSAAPGTDGHAPRKISSHQS